MQARLRAQLGDWSEYSGERRRRSVVVASIVLTITDPLRGSYPPFVQSPSCAHSLLRSFIRLHGVNHNQPFPTATSLHKILTSFAIFIVFQCFRSIASLPCKIVLGDLIQLFSKKSFCHHGFFAVKRRVVFILGEMWWALVRGWRRDCVVGGMETRFQ